jgi:hypothetical protein
LHLCRFVHACVPPNRLLLYLYLQVLDAVCSQIQLGRRLFEVGVERGFYAKVSRLGEVWFELDLHFLSLGGGEIALGWWFEECLVPYLTDTDRLATVKSISIVTGYGKTRTRGRRHGDDGMRKRCRAMLRFMGIAEHEQSNLGRIHVDKESLIEVVKKNGGRVIFDLEGYTLWKETETTANVIPDAEQKIRARFKPTIPGSGRPPFTRVESEYTSEEYRAENQLKRLSQLREMDSIEDEEYRSDINYAVRDKIRFDESSDAPMSSWNDGRQNGRGSVRGRMNHSNGADDVGHYGPANGGRSEFLNEPSRGPREQPDHHGDRHNRGYDDSDARYERNEGPYRNGVQAHRDGNNRSSMRNGQGNDSFESGARSNGYRNGGGQGASRRSHDDPPHYERNCRSDNYNAPHANREEFRDKMHPNDRGDGSLDHDGHAADHFVHDRYNERNGRFVDGCVGGNQAGSRDSVSNVRLNDDHAHRGDHEPDPAQYQHHHHVQGPDRKHPLHHSADSLSRDRQQMGDAQGYPMQNPPSDNHEAERRSSTSSRGYSLEPQPQRRRLS